MRLEGLFRLGGAEGGAGHGAEPQAIRAPSRSRWLGVVLSGPKQFRCFKLSQLLVKGIAAAALQHQHIAGAHVGTGQSPTEGPFAGGGLHHHGGQPIVTAGVEHAFFQHRARGKHAGNAAFEQGTLAGGCFELIAEGHRIAATDQLGAVALSGVMGNAGHGHAADRFAPFFAGEGELQNP